MKINMCGYDAVEDGLRAGGIDRFICNVAGEPLCNAEKAVCEGSFSASTCHKTACVIYEKDIEILKYLHKKHEVEKAALEIIILGKELRSELIERLDDLAIPLFVAENVSDIRRMTKEAVPYSELRKSPVAVFIPVRILRCRKPVHTDGKYFCDTLWRIPDAERAGRLAALECRYNQLLTAEHPDSEIHRDGCLIIAISGCAGVIYEILGSYRDVCICKLDLFTDRAGILAAGKFPRIIIVGYGSNCVKEILIRRGIVTDESIAIELSGDKLHELREIHTAIRDRLTSADKYGHHRDSSTGSFNILSYAGGTDPNAYSYNAHKVAKTPLELTTNRMCDDCPGRTEIKKILEGLHDTSVYEDIYCEKRGTSVRSGQFCASSVYSGRLVITNRQDVHYSGQTVRYIDLDCSK